MSGPDVDHRHNANGNPDHAGSHRLVSARRTGPVRQLVFSVDGPGSSGDHARLAAAGYGSYHSGHELELLSDRSGSFAFRDERDRDDGSFFVNESGRRFCHARVERRIDDLEPLAGELEHQSATQSATGDAGADPGRRQRKCDGDDRVRARARDREPR